jgi:hypothetical protein
MNGSDLATSRQVVYEFSRASALEGWWTWAVVSIGIAAVLAACVWFYRRDVAELPQGVRWTLLALRLTVLVGLVFFFFDLQRRTQRLVTRPSEVVVLVDTSQSMSLPSGTSADSQSRSDRAAELLQSTNLLAKLGDEHRTSIYAFDQQSEPRLLETRGGPEPSQFEPSDEETVTAPAGISAPRNPIALFGILCLAIAGLVSLASFAIGAAGRGGSVGWLLLTAAICMVLGIVCLGGVYTVRTGQSLAAILGVERSSDRPRDREEEEAETPQPTTIRVTDWRDAVAATGPQSRIGDAIRNVLTDHEPATLAGVVLVTDGQNNGGTDPASAVSVARRNEVSLYPVGLGSSDAPVNVRVVDIDAPKRVYPGDSFAVSAVLQASGPKPLEVDVQLLDGLDDGDGQNGGDFAGNKAEAEAANAGGQPAAGGADSFRGEVVDSQRVEVATDGSLSGVRFELEPESVGRRRLAVRVVAPPGDRNERDDLRDARYEVVSRKLRVLAIAGGPTREYRFVRNLLYRDNSIELDIWLQTGQEGMSQDADRLLRSFPSTAEALFQYDVIALFDPDWLALDASELDLVDRWLTQQAGGMIIVAGPVYHPRWTQLRTDPRVSRISGFFPVNVATRGPLLGGGRQGGDAAWPLKFTPEARRAEFLWVADDPAASFDVWDQFSGVYDYVGVKNPKPGAKVYARFSDPTTEIGGSLPVYMASQFYGAGKVFFQGSGEMWRLRGESDAYFDRYYTKLVRWVSEGRLLRDSNRGVLLVDNSRAMVGDTIAVRAVLTDDQFEPLELPRVEAKLLTPGGRIDAVTLRPLQGEPRGGTYGGRFTVREAGSYELRLTLGDALDEQVLRQSIQVRLPTIELERPRRNDEELEQIAEMTAGNYFAVSGPTGMGDVAQELVATIRPQPQTTVLPGTPDLDFSRRRNAVLMWLLASVLTFEWVTRRLHRLA